VLDGGATCKPGWWRSTTRCRRRSWPHPAPIEAAYREVVDALMAVLGCLNDQVAVLEQQLTGQFSAHPDAAIVRSQPGLGVVLGARVLGEFGDDPDRYQTAKGRKAFAGTAPVTRSPGGQWCR
jgi:transposase